MAYDRRMASTCPSCGASLEDGARVCQKCFFVVDPEHWHHDAGRLGRDERDRSHELEDPPVGPLPVAPDQSGFVGNAFKLFGVGRILRWGRRR
jgi:hypothetical protein